ncbi:hypothetical protein BI084_gp93 [Gordonia phage Terapin]|uniref:Uncharacterized protein n=4 Tax=Terapinvirus terapin TaxID=2734283 RepID=A0A345MBD2_9CAUD|nr:hypothetical protein BI084_gp93 [Gordonia phage Terapin]AOE44905.1 hypothetical protein SEA_TERAPIN_93 [Gordonia phage Terapin]AVP43369.1 hypothetical protein PBI_DJOKOVIC_92 [Gordonia phage Djokovic]AXH67803.1 hypothetical protein SEA_BEYONCAGE_92 [Gordonia phage Beyoncage]QOC56662.1 hypothetical protein SEA_BITESIZE_92 [Gordonia phage BiteSize]
MSSLEEREKAAYEKLAEVVTELTAIRDEMYPLDSSDEAEVPTCWVLCVGYESMPNGQHPGLDGSVTIFPRDGRQPGWKTSGLLGECLSHMEGERE